MGKTCFFLHIFLFSINQVKEMLANGASVNMRGGFEETYLHALMGPKPEGTESAVLAVLYQLAEAGLNVNAQDTEGTYLQRE